MDHGTKIFRIFGIDIYLHYSWWLIFILLTWSLATGFFPQFYPEFASRTYWLMGGLSALLLFCSVLLHELSHSLVARAKKIKVDSITLFFFGGIAGISKEDIKPASEFLMAIAGPIFSLLLSAVFYGVVMIDGHTIITAISFYLYQINLILALFNLVPGFPLDGGRAFRAVLYGYYKDLKKATRIATRLGRVIAGAMIILGIIGLFGGLGNGLWFILLGGFLYFIAGVSYEQVIIKEALSKVPLKELPLASLTVVDGNMLVKDFAKAHAKDGKDLFIVKDGLKVAAFQGIIDIRHILPISQVLQQQLKLRQIAQPLLHLKSIDSKANAYAAFRSFLEQNVELLPLVEKGKIIGFVSREAVINRLLWEIKFTDPHPRHVAARFHRRR